MNEELMKQYAEFAVRVGVNPQKGQTMLISCSVESAPVCPPVRQGRL